MVVNELHGFESLSVLVMSREHSERFSRFGMLAVGPVSEDSAWTILSSKVTIAEEDAQILATYCDGNPLMLEAIAGFLRLRPHRLQVSSRLSAAAPYFDERY